jgi:hypothetical protein
MFDEMHRVNKMTFVNIFIVIDSLEFFNANDFEKGVDQSKCGGQCPPHQIYSKVSPISPWGNLRS